MSIRIAVAVNETDESDLRYFGNADKYLIYEFSQDKLRFISEEINKVKERGIEYMPGSRKKGEAIISLLKEMKVNVLVSSEYCPNIKMLNKYFIPVRILPDSSKEIIQAIKNSLYWINDEYKQKPGDFKMFILSKGILKTEIEK
jgi:predicted Fe-Mo cluster-binding NifX family protein